MVFVVPYTTIYGISQLEFLMVAKLTGRIHTAISCAVNFTLELSDMLKFHYNKLPPTLSVVL
jgi:hypothetical protein